MNYVTSTIKCVKLEKDPNDNKKNAFHFHTKLSEVENK